MRRRSRLEVYLDIIRAVSKHRNPESLGRRINLSLSDTEKHLGFLASQGFLKIAKLENSKVEYELTTKGFETLEAFQKLTERESPLLEYTVKSKGNM